MIMAMQAGTVEILVEKAKFEPRVAVGIAEAMDHAIAQHTSHSQLVTLPVLNLRIGDLESRLTNLKSELVRWMLLIMMVQFALTSGMMHFLLQQLR
jgi:hypothetical protein